MFAITSQFIDPRCSLGTRPSHWPGSGTLYA